MGGGILILLLTGVISFGLIAQMDKKYAYFDGTFMKKVYFMHLFMSIVYYIYAVFNPSDSKYYYLKILEDHRGPTWADFYGTSTTFIEWFGYPFVRFAGFSYEGMMAMFSFFGFVGFVYFYLFFRENIRFKHKLFNVNLVQLIFLLPNLHFWSASFGKGAIIMMGIGMFMFALTRPNQRIILLVVGGLIIYHVRPHIMFVMLASALIGFTFSSKGISLPVRLGMILIGAVSFAFIYQDVLNMVGIDQGEELNQGLDLTHRAQELTKATSGVDITNYSLPLQLFTFLYRPLFVDAPGALGLFVSIENLFYLLISFRILNLKGFRFLVSGNFLVKTSFFSFITISIALAQISGNLGIAIRQKSQVMLLFLFVIVAFLDQQKMQDYLAFRRRKKQRERRQRLAEEVGTG